MKEPTSTECLPLDFSFGITLELVEIPPPPPCETLESPGVRVPTPSESKEKADVEENESESTTAIFLSPNQQVEAQQHSPDNGISDSASATQLTSQNVGNNNPRTPSCLDMVTKSQGGANNCPASPNYVTITAANDMTNGVGNLSYTSLTPIKSSNVEDDGGENGAYVTYVEGSSEHTIFSTTAASTPNEGVYPVYTVGESGQLYQTTGSAYYTSNPTHQIQYPQQQGNEDVSYLVPVPNNNETANANQDVSQPVSHTTRVSPATVHWLLENYETAEGVSLPRSTLYYHYMKHCTDHKLDPVNAASFGKLIRSVFIGLRTRRLGTRGNSKYHYYGIRLKATSSLNNLDEKTIDALMNNGKSHHRIQSVNGGPNSNRSFPPIPQSGFNPNIIGTKRLRITKGSDHPELTNGIPSSDAPTIKRFLGDSSHVLSNLPVLDTNTEMPDGLLPHDLAIFHSLYRELCAQLLSDMMNFQFLDFQRRWRTFFRTETSPSNVLEQQHYEDILPKSKLHALCNLRHVQDYVRRTDFQLYQNLAIILLPDVLRPIPSAMTQTIRNFAKIVESCMASAMTGYPEEMIAVKLNVLGAFGQTLRRHTSLNHLAQAARAVLQNEAQINQMLNDLNRVDFSNIEEQASWVCGCNSDLVPDLEADFKATLAQHQSLEEWAVWLESVVDRVLRPHENTSRYTAVARYFLMKWSFYSSLVIRDLTLRSAASFGSFHLLRLLYDEYMFYLIENRVARSINTLPIAILGKKLLNPFILDPSTDEDSESNETLSTHKDCHPQSYANSENDLQYHHDQSNSPRSTTSNGNVASVISAVQTSPECQPVPQEHNGVITRRELKQRMKNFALV